jgi:REP element-mobilizing transposase RayT
MPRPLRPIHDGLIYHVINRGNNRQDVFHKRGDFGAFLTAIADLKERRPFELYGYCLMSNHIHLLIRPRRGASISASFRACWSRTPTAITNTIGRAATSGKGVSKAG